MATALNEQLFQKAVYYVNNGSVPMGNSAKLRLYALFKQVKDGDVGGSRPWRMTARAKWDARAQVKGTPKHEAARMYVHVLRELVPGWEVSDVMNSFGS